MRPGINQALTSRLLGNGTGRPPSFQQRINLRAHLGRGLKDLLHLVVGDQGLPPRGREEKKPTMENYWVPGVNNLKTYGRWAVAEFTDVFEMETDFAKKVAAEFDRMITAQTGED
ncbi:MAG: hypothetical protein ACYCOR_20925 [Acidobacteriaceae bacterium]